MSGYPSSRRDFLALAAAQSAARGERLGWRAIVDRRKPALYEVDPRSPLTVGNGEFAFTADVTWLQSLGRAYQR